MEPSFIELKLISCKDIKAFNFFQKLTLYAQVSISTTNPTTQLTDQHKQQQRTPTDRDSDDDGSNPEWNHQTRFDLAFLSQQHSDPSDFFLSFEFRHDGVILGDKILGECRVPLTDLIRDVDGVARFVSYEIRSGDGKSNGIFNFSYKLVGIGIGIGIHSSQILDGRISGYPVLKPEDCAPVQYPTSEFERPCCYPTVCSVQEGPFRATAPASFSYPSSGGYDNCYPPQESPHYTYPPPPESPQYRYPPPPPQVEQPYPTIGPEAHHWQQGPYYEHRW